MRFGRLGASLMHNRKRCPGAFLQYVHACPQGGTMITKYQVQHTAELEWEESMTDQSEQMLYV